MKKPYATLLLAIFFTFSVSSFSQNLKQVSADSDKSTIELLINGDRIEIPNMPQNIKIDIFSIIGSKMASVNVRQGLSDNALVLTKGYYIIKANNFTRKIAVR